MLSQILSYHVGPGNQTQITGGQQAPACWPHDSLFKIYAREYMSVWGMLYVRARKGP